MNNSFKARGISFKLESEATLGSSDFSAKLFIHSELRKKAYWTIGHGAGILLPLILSYYYWIPDEFWKKAIYIFLLIYGTNIAVRGIDSYLFESACINNLKVAIGNRLLLVDMILNGDPFALYLHDVASEFPKYFKGPGFVPYILFSNESEQNLSKRIGNRLPVFAFLNHWDPFPGPFLRILAADDEEWFRLFRLYCDAAALVIFDLDEVGDSIRSELNHVKERGLSNKTVFFLTPEAQRVVSTEFYDVYNTAAFSALRKERHLGVPDLPEEHLELAISRKRKIATISIQQINAQLTLIIKEEIARLVALQDFEAMVIVIFYADNKLVNINLIKTTHTLWRSLVNDISEGLSRELKEAQGSHENH